ncbi:MAG: hypothetical protein ACYTGX_07080 [Planctomycetota bacterium]|jgi:hypothetical protein
MQAAKRLSEHWRPLLGAGAAGFLPLVVLFWATLGTDRLYMGHDIGLQQLALVRVAREALAAGEIPFWNPKMFAGTPLLAPANAGVLSPVWIATAWLPFTLAFTVSAMLSLWLAYAGAAWCAWQRTRSLPGSILAGYVFMLCAPVFLRTFAGHTSILGCVWAMPWMFAAGEGLLRKVSGANLCVLACATAVLMIGNPHIAMLSVLAFGTMMTGRAAWRWRADRDLRRWGGVLAWTAGAGFLGVLLAAPQLLPGFEWAAHSSRSGGLPLEIAKSGSAGLNHLPYFLFPAFYGDTTASNANVMAPPPVQGGGIPTYWEVCGYAGVLPLILVALAWSAGRGRVYGGIALTAVGFALAHHTPLTTIAYYLVPKFDLLRTPGRWLMVTGFALAICAAEGLALLQREDELGTTARRRFRWVAGGAAAIALLTALAATGQPVGIVGGPDSAVAGVPPIAHVTLLLALAAAGGLAAAYHFAPELAKGLLPGLVVVTLVELYLFVAPFVQVERASDSRWPRTVAAAAERLEPGWRFDVAPVTRPDWVRGNHPPIHGYSTAGGYDPAVLRRYMQLYNTVHGLPFNQPTWNAGMTIPEGGAMWSRLLPLLHTRWVVTRSPQLPSPMRLLTQEAGVHLYEYPRPLPRAYVVHMTRVLAEVETPATPDAPPPEPAALQALRTQDFVLHEEAIVAAGGPALDAAPPDAPEPVTVKSETPHRVVLEADVKAVGLLVLCDTWYPGWRCTVNGVETAIHRTNHAYRGVAVTAGRQEVIFTYHCAPFRNGLLIAFAALAALAGSTWWLRRREQQAVPEPEPAPEDAPAEDADAK